MNQDIENTIIDSVAMLRMAIQNEDWSSVEDVIVNLENIVSNDFEEFLDEDY